MNGDSVPLTPPQPGEDYAAHVFGQMNGLSRSGGAKRVLGADVIALDPAHVSALVRLPPEQWEELTHVRISADLLLRAIATMQTVSPHEDIVLSLHKQADYPVLVHPVEYPRYGILLSPRKRPEPEAEEVA